MNNHLSVTKTNKPRKVVEKPAVQRTAYLTKHVYNEELDQIKHNLGLQKEAVKGMFLSNAIMVLLSTLILLQLLYLT